MAVNKDIRENLPKGSVVFDNYAYDNSIIGISTDGRVVYSYEKMIEELVQDEGMSEIEAMEWINYNTVRALHYGGQDGPIICEGLMV
jgi:hypothetical protein